MNPNVSDYTPVPAMGYGIGCEVVLVTPEIAQHWLGRRLPNRKIKRRNIERFAASMAAGRWVLGPTLLFTKNWRLLDGQNRLEAVVKADTPVYFVCVYGIPEESFSAIDDRTPRSVGDVLDILGEKDTKKLSSVLRFVNTFDSLDEPGAMTFGRSSGLTNDMVPEIAEKYKDVHDVLPSTDKGYRKFPRYTVLLSCRYLFSRIDRQMADYFFDKLINGENLLKGNPIHLLRERLLSLRAMRHVNPSPELVYALTVKTWNAYRQGRTLGVLKWMESESLPTPE